jgi:hypothetical protein
MNAFIVIRLAAIQRLAIKALRLFDFDHHQRPTNMDSTLNLKTLASSLPNSNLAGAEKDLLNNFKGIDIFLIHPQPGGSQ